MYKLHTTRHTRPLNNETTYLLVLPKQTHQWLTGFSTTNRHHLNKLLVKKKLIIHSPFVSERSLACITRRSTDHRLWKGSLVRELSARNNDVSVGSSPGLGYQNNEIHAHSSWLQALNHQLRQTVKITVEAMMRGGEGRGKSMGSNNIHCIDQRFSTGMWQWRVPMIFYAFISKLHFRFTRSQHLETE